METMVSRATQWGATGAGHGWESKYGHGQRVLWFVLMELFGGRVLTLVEEGECLLELCRKR